MWSPWPELQKLASFAHSGRLPQWLFTAMADAEPPPAAPTAAPSSAEDDVARLVASALPLVLDPLRAASADEPSTALRALTTFVGHEHAGRAVELLLAPEVASLRSGMWGGRQLQARGGLAALLACGAPMVAGAALTARNQNPNAPQNTNMDRLASARGGSEMDAVRQGLHAGLGRLHAAAHAVLKTACTAGAAPREAALAWLSLALTTAEPRAKGIRSSHQMHQMCRCAFL